ncbi:peroxiredoxin [Costertonia aggregata]|uniref:thioredoxin-dependent peroxiredoxin n=1 Tax=Costertonia aggregata TaxID=343403 RepID=A0A7H9ALS1_9FLAO|nr:peroxiredoxin [Costertonia aggregata]QLG44225.1 peroxiredoxin [Costertonia aggregata]
MGLKIGDTIPEFSLRDQNGNTFSTTEWVGKKPLVIYFYPKDNTPGCTAEACSFRDSYEEFTELGAEVIGISSDTENSHQKFTEKHNLPFILLADTQNKVRRLFKVEKSLFILPGRETYVVDKQGEIIMVFNNVTANQHVKRALKALKKIV